MARFGQSSSQRLSSTHGLAYSTAFPLTETPIAEGSRWTKSGLGQTNVVTSPGLAVGTSSVPGGGATADSAAILTGSWPADMRVSCVVQKVAGTTAFQEVEILLRASAGVSALQGYEIMWEQGGGYLGAVRRNGTNGGVANVDFTGLVTAPTTANPADGDVFSAEIKGFFITTYINNVVIWTTDIRLNDSGAAIAPFASAGGGSITVIPGGSVGIGFDGPSGAYTDSRWAYKSFSAVAL